jgi:hypothetical protein
MKQVPVSKLEAGKQYWMMGGKVTAVKNCFSLAQMIKRSNKRKDFQSKLYEEMSFVREDNNTVGFFYKEDTLIEVGSFLNE